MIDKEKLLTQALELLEGKIGGTREATATNRLAGAVLMHALLTQSPVVHLNHPVTMSTGQGRIVP